jgi:hypothetical protein
VAWPYHNDSELNAAGYELDSVSKCWGKDCGQTIEWWVTPNGKKMPIDPETKKPHFGTCPNLKEFRK